jgi:hypothetical protein
MTETCPLTQEQLDAIRELAYEKFVARGCENGHDIEDWLEAEDEVRSSSKDKAPKRAKVAA